MHIRRWAYSLINLTWELFTSKNLTWKLFAGMNLTWELLADINLTWELFAGISLTWELFAGISLTWELFAGINLTWELFAGINLTWELFAGHVSDMYSPLWRLEWYNDLVVQFTVTNYTNTLQEQKQSGGWCDISHKDNWCYLTNKYYDFFDFSSAFIHSTLASVLFSALSNLHDSKPLHVVHFSLCMCQFLCSGGCFGKKEEEKKGFSALMFFVCF